MTPSAPTGSLHRRPRAPAAGVWRRRWGAGAAALVGVLAGVVAPSLPAQEVMVDEGAPGASIPLGEVERHRVPEGPEVWLAPLPGSGPAGISLVFLRRGGGGGVRALAGRVADACPGPSPVLGAGPDYEILSVERPSAGVPEAIACLGRVLAEARGSAPEASRGRGGLSSAAGGASAQAFAAEVEAYRSASGVLMANLYAPAPVPGSAPGGGEGGSGLPLPSHVVVAGSFDPREVARRADAGLGGLADTSAGAAEAEVRGPAPRPPVTTEVLILHRPGEPLAELRVGQLTLPGDHPDWTALVVGREILAERLREGSWAFAELLRVRGPGAFVAGTRLPPDQAGAALDGLWREVDELRDRLPDPEEVRAATARLRDSFEGATVRAAAVADELARVAALGLGPEAVAQYPARLATLTPAAVRQSFRAHLDPERFVVSASGDGPALAAALGRFGPVRTVEPPRPPGDWPTLTVRGRELNPWVSRYRVRIGEEEVGTVRRVVARVGGERLRISSTARIGDTVLEQEVEASLPELDFVEGTTVAGGEGKSVLRLEGDRLVGSRPDGGRVDLVVPRGTVVSDLLEPVLWASTLEVGATHRVPVTTPDGGRVRWAAVRVSGPEPITVPAGTFETLRVDVTGPELLTLWLRRDRPHRTVRLVSGNGVVLELEEEGPPDPRDGIR